MCTAVFAEEIVDGQPSGGLPKNEYPYKVFDAFGTLLMGMPAGEFALFSQSAQDDVIHSLDMEAVYVVTIDQNGIITNMQTTQQTDE